MTALHPSTRDLMSHTFSTLLRVRLNSSQYMSATAETYPMRFSLSLPQDLVSRSFGATSAYGLGHLPRHRSHVVSVKAKQFNNEPVVKLKKGIPVDGPDLSVTTNGLDLPNPFIIASGPPGTNYAVMKKALDEGWGGIICKTLNLETIAINNVTPRYAQLRSRSDRAIAGWENIELISDRPFESMIQDLNRLRDEYPDRVLIASIMEQYNKESWEEIVKRVEATGIDGIELNFSCPHGLPDLGMGMAMGQNPEILKETCTWICSKATVPVWAKMTPNITDISVPARASLLAGCQGISAINTIRCISGVDLNTLKPLPTVEGYTTPGGYSFKAIKPIALAHVEKCARLIKDEFNGEKTLSAIGGIETGSDAAEFLLLGATTVQVCTGVMIYGYAVIQQLCAGLQAFMTKHGFEHIDDFRGYALPYVTTHEQLVKMQRSVREERKTQSQKLIKDEDWTGDSFSEEAQSMVGN